MYLGKYPKHIFGQWNWILFSDAHTLSVQRPGLNKYYLRMCLVSTHLVSTLNQFQLVRQIGVGIFDTDTSSTVLLVKSWRPYDAKLLYCETYDSLIAFNTQKRRNINKKIIQNLENKLVSLRLGTSAWLRFEGFRLEIMFLNFSRFESDSRTHKKYANSLYPRRCAP